ncbi:MAG: glycosyltransferase [Akkermansia sp.]
MPEPYHNDDIKELVIRVPMKRLSSVQWWKSQKIDVVVLYSWAKPEYILVARAIHKAGIRLVLHLDMGRAYPPLWDKSISSICKRSFVFCRRVAADLARSKHMRYADIITATKIIQEEIRNRRFYGDAVADKFFECPTMIASHFKYEGQVKESTIVTCANWTAGNGVKRPEFLMACVDVLLQREQFAASKIEIYGKPTKQMLAWHEGLSAEERKRVRMYGFINNEDLVDINARAQISLCFSRHESLHIASLEALCSGCSIVVANRERLRIVRSYTENGCGSVTKEDTPESMAEAILDELAEWKAGARNPMDISRYWQNKCSACYVIPRILRAPCKISTESKYNPE